MHNLAEISPGDLGTIDMTTLLPKESSDAIPLRRNITRKAKANLSVLKYLSVPKGRADIPALKKTKALRVEAIQLERALQNTPELSRGVTHNWDGRVFQTVNQAGNVCLIKIP
ncbi:hypothetical protein FGIG_10616 [Fasciola gigantica]|uniref:Uncharacterized protein n=1 Tax=Fasciola gigantica TaxID=46835 RepID=A0A504YBA7_FASGI|nr:hypothetical protein FGIG_10616 [Fasciola gigantica]